MGSFWLTAFLFKSCQAPSPRDGSYAHRWGFCRPHHEAGPPLQPYHPAEEDAVTCPKVWELGVAGFRSRLALLPLQSLHGWGAAGPSQCGVGGSHPERTESEEVFREGARMKGSRPQGPSLEIRTWARASPVETVGTDAPRREPTRNQGAQKPNPHHVWEKQGAGTREGRDFLRSQPTSGRASWPGVSRARLPPCPED